MSSEIVKALKAWDTYDPNISEEKVLRQAHAVIDAARPLLARIEALEAEVARMSSALEPFAGVAELVDLETEGFSETDTFELMFNDFLFDRFTLADFREARRAREGGNEDG